eukprot:CAMPEP_0173409942 /NCGR_PEP_ID=MMETSP1356-20130122/73427_1 /TAXON_ID=77927 ORGANISM="Hemiselmis virescens, Strain PCC157" /NCGR_SAMPLE_ID=MMETSP1356 /ASSEMBLY_ACC=CAM_ASM_000847 /LENGTH=131 /DNA_ID=CAMNT_0014371503 /DNA_START=358 /DNA_END=750 /DNA_ORIENTATION=-
MAALLTNDHHLSKSHIDISFCANARHSHHRCPKTSLNAAESGTRIFDMTEGFRWGSRQAACEHELREQQASIRVSRLAPKPQEFADSIDLLHRIRAEMNPEEGAHLALAQFTLPSHTPYLRFGKRKLHLED